MRLGRRGEGESLLSCFDFCSSSLLSFFLFLFLFARYVFLSLRIFIQLFYRCSYFVCFEIHLFFSWYLYLVCFEIHLFLSSYLYLVRVAFGHLHDPYLVCSYSFFGGASCGKGRREGVGMAGEFA